MADGNEIMRQRLALLAEMKTDPGRVRTYMIPHEEGVSRSTFGDGIILAFGDHLPGQLRRFADLDPRAWFDTGELDGIIAVYCAWLGDRKNPVLGDLDIFRQLSLEAALGSRMPNGKPDPSKTIDLAEVHVNFSAGNMMLEIGMISEGIEFRAGREISLERLEELTLLPDPENMTISKEEHTSTEERREEETRKIMHKLEQDHGNIRTYAIPRDSVHEDGDGEYFGDTLLLTFGDKLPFALERLAAMNPGRDLPLDDIWNQIHPGFAGEHGWEGVLGDMMIRRKLDFSVAGETTKMKIDVFLDTDKQALRLSMWATDSTASREMYVPVAELKRLAALPDPNAQERAERIFNIAQELKNNPGRIRAYRVPRLTEEDKELFGDSLLMAFGDNLPLYLERVAAVNPGAEIPLDDFWNQFVLCAANNDDTANASKVVGTEDDFYRLEDEAREQTVRMLMDVFLDTSTMNVRVVMRSKDSCWDECEMFVPVAELKRLAALPDEKEEHASQAAPRA